MSKLLPASGYCLLLCFGVINPILTAQETAQEAASKDDSRWATFTDSLTSDSATSKLQQSVGEFLKKLNEKQFVEASADFETLVKAHWNASFQSYVTKQLHKETSSLELKVALKVAMHAHPKDPALHRLFGYIQFLNKEDEKIVHDRLDKAIELDATNAVPFFIRGVCDRFSRIEEYMPRRSFRGVFAEENTKSLADISEAIRLDQTSPQFYLSRAERSGIYLGNKDAIDDIAAAMKLGHDPFECLLIRGQINSALGDNRAAVNDLDEAIALYESQMTDNFRGAYVHYNQLISVDPPLADCYYHRGLSKAELKDYRGAIDDFNAAFDRSKHLSRDLYENRALMFIAIKDYPAALADLNKAGDFFRQLERRGWVKLQLKDYQGALTDYDNALAAYEEDSEALVGRGITKHRMGDREGAMNDFNKAVNLVGFFKVEPSLARGMLYLDLNDPQQAIIDFNNAIQIEPENVGAYFQRGLANHALKNYSAAIADFDSVIRLEPNNVGAFFNRGLSQRAAENFSDAIANFDAAIKRDSKHLRSYYFRGLTKHDTGDNTAALVDYDSALNIDPKYINAFLQRAISKIVLNDFASALADYDTAIELDSNSLKAIAAKSFLLATCSDLSLRDPKAASDLANRALEIDAEDPQAINARACADAATGDFTSAISLQEDALKYNRFTSNKDLDGGNYAKERIAAWQASKLWTIPAPAK